MCSTKLSSGGCETPTYLAGLACHPRDTAQIPPLAGGQGGGLTNLVRALASGETWMVMTRPDARRDRLSDLSPLLHSMRILDVTFLVSVGGFNRSPHSIHVDGKRRPVDLDSVIAERCFPAGQQYNAKVVFRVLPSATCLLANDALLRG